MPNAPSATNASPAVDKPKRRGRTPSIKRALKVTVSQLSLSTLVSLHKKRAADQPFANWAGAYVADALAAYLAEEEEETVAAAQKAIDAEHFKLLSTIPLETITRYVNEKS